MGLLRSTGIVAFSTLLSRILGFLRDMVFANYFGASGATDAFFVAFRIPNLLRRLVAEGALTISFIPVYTDYLLKNGKDEALVLAQKVLTLLTLAVFIMVAAGIIFSPQIVGLFAFGFTDIESLDLAVSLNRIMFPYLLFVSFVAFAMGFLNPHGYFFAPSFAPVLLNAGMITGIVYLSTLFREPLYGVALGVLVGGVLQLILQLPYLFKSGFRMSFSIDFDHPGIRRILRLMAPALLGIAVYQINILMSTILASFLEPGSITYLYYSDRLTEIVLGVFIVSIGNVVLPEMSRLNTLEDRAGFQRLYISSSRAALFLAVPAAAGLMSIGYPIISTLFMRGEFTPESVLMTNRALFFASIGIAAIAIVRITTPAFYALKETRLPVVAAAVSFVINISLGALLMQTPLRHAGLALANSMSVIAQMTVLFLFLNRRIKTGSSDTGSEVSGLNLKELIPPLMKFIAASMLMVPVVLRICSYVDWNEDHLLKRIVFLMTSIGAGGAVYIGACAALKVDEVFYAMRRLPVVKRFFS